MAEKVFEPIVLEDLLYVLAEAVEAYEVAAMRDRSGYISRGYTAETLIKNFPKYFSRQSSGKAKYIGKSADEILENYLQGLGYNRNSQKWYKLAQCVVDLATEEVKDVESYLRETKAKRQGRNRSRNERKIRGG
tara:strand:+ start:111 stop:512 length:402 start_codon:yes stop_codon:yes gene_type:complete